MASKPQHRRNKKAIKGWQVILVSTIIISLPSCSFSYNYAYDPNLSKKENKILKRNCKQKVEKPKANYRLGM